MKNNMPASEMAAAIFITLALTVLDVTGYPAALFLNVSLADIQPIIPTLMVNQLILILLGLAAVRLFCPHLTLGLSGKGLAAGLRRFLPFGLLMTAVTMLAFYLGLLGRYDYAPTVWKVLIEGIVYYIGVAVIEEIYIRGLLLNILRRLFSRRRQAALLAILLSSCLFGLGHIVGMIGLDLPTIFCRVIWTTALGIFFGVLYVWSENLWVPITVHFLVDLCGIPFCFTTDLQYPPLTTAIVLVTYVLFAAGSLFFYLKREKARCAQEKSA